MTRLFWALATTCLAISAHAAELPEAIKRAGVLNLSINSTYAPMEALRGLIADGTYAKILARYELLANAVPEPLLNAATQ